MCYRLLRVNGLFTRYAFGMPALTHKRRVLASLHGCSISLVSVALRCGYGWFLVCELGYPALICIYKPAGSPGRTLFSSSLLHIKMSSSVALAATATTATTASAASAGPSRLAFDAPARGVLRPCCIRRVRAFKYDVAAVCMRRNRWTNCERCQTARKKCEEVSRSPSVVVSC